MREARTLGGLQAGGGRSQAWLHVAPVRDPAVAEFRRDILDLLASHPDALDRRGRPGHVTGSALVVDPATGLVLLLFHAKLRVYDAAGANSMLLITSSPAILPGSWDAASS